MLEKADHSRTCTWHLMTGHDWDTCFVKHGTDEACAKLRSFANEHEWLRGLGKEREAVFARLPDRQRQRLQVAMDALRRGEKK